MDSSTKIDFEAEQAVLGAIIEDNHVLSEVASLITPLSFFSKAHQKIFAAMMELAEKGQTIDEITLGDQLKSKGQLETSGGYVYLAELLLETPSSDNVAAYAKIVLEKWKLRRLEEIAEKIKQSSSSENAIARGIQAMEALASSGSSELEKAVEIGERLAITIATNQDNGVIPGLRIGYKDLEDRITFKPSDLIILAARPAMGKTAFMLNLVKNVVFQEQGSLVFSLEMSKEQLLSRLFSIIGNIDSEEMRTGNVSAEGWDKITVTLGELTPINLWIDDTPSISLNELRAKAKKHMARHPYKLLCVDYLQLMRGDSMNREQEISEISRGLKALAKELGITVLALSQLNRKLEERKDRRPVLSDLRESGAIEQDADTVLMLYRDEVYDEHSADKGIAEVIARKVRDGDTGTTKLYFNGKLSKFSSLSRS